MRERPGFDRNVLYLDGVGYTSVCICQKSRECTLQICAFQCINLIWKFYIKHIETNIDFQLMMCVLTYLEGSVLMPVIIYLEMHQK